MDMILINVLLIKDKAHTARHVALDCRQATVG